MIRRLNSLIRSVGPVVVAAAVAIVLAVGCGSSGSAPPPPPPGGAPKPAPKPSALASASASAMPPVVFNEADFTESDSSRDPFHAFSQVVRPAAELKTAPQYTVLLEKFSVDELKLVAIIKSGEYRAMFVDPQGKGWMVARGMHLGRGEIVKIGAGAQSSYQLHWKVDRIKENEVVLVREDTLHPEILPTYREIPLHLESEKT